MENMGILHPETHMFFNQGMKRHGPAVVGAIMTQLSLKAGLKRCGKKGRNEIHYKMKQIQMRDIFFPLHWKNMSHKQKKQTLEYHLLLKDKQDGTIKGRTVAGGNNQRNFISKENASSPTVST